MLTVFLSLALVALAPERMAVREPPEPAGVTPHGVFGAAFVAVATAPLTAVLAYRNDGIVVCWLVAFLPALGVTVVTMLFPVYLPVERVLHDLERAVAFACVAGVLGGTVGFGLGVGGRRLLRGLGALRGDSERPPHDGS